MSEKKQRSRLQRRFSRRVWYLVLLSVVAVSFSIGFIFLKDYFSVKQIRVSSNQKTSDLRGVAELYNNFLPLLSPVSIEKAIVKQNPAVSQVKVQKEFPNTLSIKVKTLEPVAFIVIENEYALLAPSGRVTARTNTKPSNLPEIVYYQKLLKDQVKVGDTLNFIDIVNAIHFLNLVKGGGFVVLKVDIKGFYMIRLLLEGSREILVTTEKNIDTQEYQIKAILRQFKIQGKGFKSLDVRFDKPVVVFE